MHLAVIIPSLTLVAQVRFMHCVRLAELAATISQHGPAFVASRSSIPSTAVSCYWTACRNRFDLWHQAVGRYHIAQRQGNWALMQQWWRRHYTVLEEVLVGEMLTRIVAAVTAAMESKTNRDEVSPVTEAVFLSHLDACNRVHDLMLHGRGNTVQDAVRLNRLRTGVERWTDALLGQVSLNAKHCVRFAMDRERAQMFADETRVMGVSPQRKMSNWLMTAAMRDVLSRRTSHEPALPQSTKNVADTVMSLFQPDLFDDFGVVKSLSLQHICNQPDSDTQPFAKTSRDAADFLQTLHNTRSACDESSAPENKIDTQRW